MSLSAVSLPPPEITGTIYGPLLNEQGAWDRYADQMSQDPYKAPPTVPVLYIKPRNTVVGDGTTVVLPSTMDRVELGASVGLVFARPAARRSAGDAMACVGGLALVLDLSQPRESIYRPPIVEKCFDGACPVGSTVVAPQDVDLATLTLRTFVNDTCVAERRFDDLRRPAPQLIADVSDFMSLLSGDVLTLGYPVNGVPTAGRGDRIRIEADGFAPLTCTLSPETAP